MTRPTAPLPLTTTPPDMQGELQFLREELAALRKENEELRRLVLGAAAPEPRLAFVTPAPAFDPLPPPPPPPRAAPSFAPPGVVPAAFTLPELGPVSDAGRQQGIDFGAVMQLTPDKLDGLPYGLITLDAKGRVIYYNDTESRLVGLPKDRVIGRNFFREVAPCTRIREFEGRFTELAANPTEVRVQSFDFVFKFARGEQHVSVVMTPARVRGQFHLALLRRHRPAGG